MIAERDTFVYSNFDDEVNRLLREEVDKRLRNFDPDEMRRVADLINTIESERKQ